MTGPSAPLVALDCRAATARTGGVGRYVVNLARELRARDELRLALLVGADPHPALASMKGVEVVETGWTAAHARQDLRFAWEQRVLRRILARLRPGLFHATWNLGIPVASRVPAVLTLHDLLPLSTPGWFGARAHRAFFLAGQWAALLRARRVIAVSGATRAALAILSPRLARKAVVVHEGVEDDFAPGPAGAGPRYLLAVGGREARKNLAGLFAAYAASGLGAELHVTGGEATLGPVDRAALDALPPLMRARIRFLGFVPDAALPGLYRGASMLVFPSRGEGFGLPPLEAMACGTPVVAGRAGSIPEVVGDAALLVDPGDPDAIAAAMRRIDGDDGLRARLVADGLARAAALRWPSCAEATLAVYRAALGGSSSLRRTLRISQPSTGMRS
jgi:glycosyltransferase involved in cell wall biosynthesis